MKISKLFSDRSKWCQHALAVDADGHRCDPWAVGAVKWSFYGALIRCYENIEERVSKSMMINKRLALICFIDNWNDKKERKFEEVKAIVTELNL